MRDSKTVFARRDAAAVRRPLALALSLSLGMTPLISLAATISVTATDDAGNAGTCTLRQAIVAMNTAALTGTGCLSSGAAFGTSDTINFDITTFPLGGGNTISLADVSTGTLQVTDLALTIDAGSNGGVTIQRPNSHTHSFGILNASTNGSSLTLKSLTVQGGATGACGNNGGGICAANNVNLTLVNSTLSGNSSASRGGGIYSGYGSVTLTNSTLSSNSAGGDGGGIFSLRSSVTVTNSTLNGNSAPTGAGGGIEELTGSLNVSGSTFSANTAKWGGGTDSNVSSLTFVNSTLTGNSASQTGGAIRHTSGTTLSLTNSTVSANTAGYTGGIFSDHFGAQLTNSIVAGNSAGDANFSADFINVGSFVGGDPQLGALADNGGPTQTMLPLAGSPVVDAVACTNAPAKDQRGVARPQGAQCDIGAVEVGHPASLTVDTTADTLVEDGKCSLREAIVIFTQGRTGTDCTPSASAVNEVLFAPALANNSIAVASPLALDNNVEVTIDGSAAPGLAIDGGNATFIFNVLAGSTVAIQHLRMVNGNSAGSDGGAIDNAGTLTLTDTALNNNISNGGGGAINNLGTLNIDHSTLSNNFSSASGGAISAQTGVLTVTASTINDNIAAAGGGVFVAAGGTLNLIGSNVSTNHASATSGGGVGGNGHFVVANSTFSANTAAADGGAIYNNKASNTNKVVNSTLAGNTAANGGNLANAAGTLLLQNSIVANSGGGGNCHGTVTAGTGFMTWPASDTTCGAFSIGNPVLGPLQDNGGPTFTMLPGAGSALLDAGNSATCAAAPVSNRDQRGVARPQGAGCDIGAVELVTDRIFAGNFDGTPPL